MADGKGLCRLPRTAKGSGKVGYGKELLCRLLSEADGKGAFAISGGQAKKADGNKCAVSPLGG